MSKQDRPEFGKCKEPSCTRFAASKRLGLCNMHAQRHNKATTLQRNGRTSDDKRRERIMKRVTVDPATGCWIHGSRTAVSPRGRIVFDGKSVFPYVEMARIAMGDKPPGNIVLHLCDRGNDGCCNPSHLAYGTHAQNMSHMVSSGRARPAGGGSGKVTKSIERDTAKTLLLALGVDAKVFESFWSAA